MCLIVSDIWWDSKISNEYSPSNFHSRLDEEQQQTLIFYIATDTVADLVNIERAGNKQQDAVLPF